MAADFAKGRNVTDLPADLQRALRRVLKSGKADLDAQIEGEVDV